MSTSTRNDLRKVVLIVEDEPVLRMMAIDLVEDAGFEALTANDAEEAIEILQSRNDVRLIFTDIDMPGGRNGLMLAALVRDRWPPIGILITSGKLSVADIDMPVRSEFVSKPYRADAVAAMIERMTA